jgi:YbbR domain-containing protein
VGGPREVLTAVTVSSLEATVDISGLASGQYQLPVNVVAPPRVLVVRTDPAQVQVRIR